MRERTFFNDLLDAVHDPVNDLLRRKFATASRIAHTKVHATLNGVVTEIAGRTVQSAGQSTKQDTFDIAEAIARVGGCGTALAFVTAAAEASIDVRLVAAALCGTGMSLALLVAGSAAAGLVETLRWSYEDVVDNLAKAHESALRSASADFLKELETGFEYAVRNSVHRINAI